MKRATALLIAAFTLGGGCAGYWLAARNVSSAAPAPQRSPAPVAAPASVIAAPGKVEPVSEEVQVGADIGGKLKSVLVEEGETVARGQTLAVIENAEYAARAAAAAARLAEREAALERVVNGARAMERREAQASIEEADAMLENARLNYERRRALYEKGDLSREQADLAEREYRVAHARRAAARERFALVDADARAEDRTRAEAAVALAKAELQEARALYEKTFIRAPISGVVLHKRLRAGEIASATATPPTVVVTLGDAARLRVRADVDESDVGKLRVGQAAYVTARAYGDKKFPGRVVKIGQALGRKNFRTEEPTERVDTKILETLIELEAGTALPIGLRVDAFIQ
jgi:HlyD family secretion protein